MATAPQQEGVFAERLTGVLAPEGLWFGAPLLGVGTVLTLAGLVAAGVTLVALAGFMFFFFRNPAREIAGGERDVVAPADGRVLAVGEVERSDGSKGLRIGIFLSIFNVHVNRAPVAGKVVGLERSGNAFKAAFDAAAEDVNVRLDLDLETEHGERVRVSQITGLIARRIVCQPELGEWLTRGVRYGLIRFGSRTDVVLPLGSVPRVAVGDRVRGGSTVLAALPEAP